MHHPRTLILGALAALVPIVGAGCVAMPSAGPFTNTGGPQIDCFAAVSTVWPPALQAKARSIVWRESRNRPSAQNRRSSAAGCFQMLKLHSPRFARLGFNWSTDRYDAWANASVALDLYREQGWRPWR